MNHPFPLRVWRRLPTCDRCEIGERQRIFSTVGEHSVLPCRNLYAVPDTVLLHRPESLRRRDITVSRNPLTRCNGRHLRIRRLVQFIFVGAVYHNALTNCAALLCRALRRVNRLCSSTVSGTANMSRHGSTLCSPTVDKLLCRSLFSERSHVGNLRQTLQRKRGDSQEGGKPQVVYPLVRPRGVSAVPFASQAKSPQKRKSQKN